MLGSQCESHILWAEETGTQIGDESGMYLQFAKRSVARVSPIARASLLKALDLASAVDGLGKLVLPRHLREPHELRALLHPLQALRHAQLRKRLQALITHVVGAVPTVGSGSGLGSVHAE